jgi:hypothetical protein
LEIKKGDRLGLQRRPTSWPGWVWCTSKEGKAAWVPESWVLIDRHTCTALRDYRSVELALRAGEEVVGDLTEGGWVWARDGRGNSGWVPLDCLEAIDDE